MKLFRLTIVVIAAILAVMSLILMRAAPWLGFILLLMAIVVVIAALVAEQPKKHSNQRITREGIDMGTMMYRFDGSKVLLSVKLEEMLALTRIFTRRRLHQGQVPEVAVVVDDRDAERSPAVRTCDGRSYRGGNRNLRGARRSETRGESTHGGTFCRSVAERPSDGIAIPFLGRHGRRFRNGERPHQQHGGKRDRMTVLHDFTTIP